MISYNKLWKLLIDQGLNKTQLMRLSGVSTNVIAKLGKSESVPLEAIEKICIALKCDVGDIVEIILNEEQKNEHRK